MFLILARHIARVGGSNGMDELLQRLGRPDEARAM